ncbi:MAG TPA: hypothetical protein VEC93_04960, partial [Anaerolineae bacterium]|nr:hypothetical protein [Anaerolineae bacterium]
HNPSTLPPPQPSKFILFYLVLLITFAFGLRLVSLDSLPLSLSLDEAIDGLDALQLFRLRWLTPFLQSNFGRETFFFYFQGVALWLYGVSIFSLRFASVLAGTLTIPLLYRVGQRLDFERLTFNIHGSTITVSLLAATGLAVSYWHIYFSRVALRAILLPPLLLGLIWCFWQGWHSPLSKGGRLWLAAAGFLLGLTFYTYLAARLLPVLFAVFIAIELIRNQSNRQENLIGILIFGGSAAVTTVPLIFYFLQNPQALSSRTQVISIFASDTPVEMLVNNFLALCRVHFLGGVWLGQWPALDLLSAVGFLVGLLICLYHLKKPAYLFLLLWWLVGTAPVLLSEQDWGATTTLLRGIIAWPALYLISAIGLATLSLCISKLASRRIIHHLWPPPLVAGHSQFTIHNSPFIFPLVLLLLFGAFSSIYNYFFVWATNYNNLSDHPPYMARYLNSQTEQLTLTPLKFYGETVVNFLLQANYPHLVNADNKILRSLLEAKQPAVYLLPDESTAEAAFVLLAPAVNGQGTAYLLPPLTPLQIEAMAQHTRHLPPLTTVSDWEQEPIAQVYPLAADAPFLPSPETEI